MTSVLFLVLLLGIVTGAEAVYYFVRYLSERSAEELRRRLQTVGAPNAGPQILRRRRLASSDRLNELLAGFDLAERIERLLDQSDSKTSVAGVLLRMMLLALAGGVLAMAMQRTFAAAVFVPLFGASPLLLALRARAERAKKISEQLPDALEMMARAVKAGHALPVSFKFVAQECPPPIASEFAKAYEQQNLGLSLDAAAHSMTERVPGCLDLKLLAVAIRIQNETGGNLVEVLERIAETMRDRFKFQSKLRALTAEGRISGVILGALPVVVAFLLSITNPGYLSELGQGLGRAILACGFVLWVSGILWIRQLTKVAY
ncbi:type II secretion system F family protein [Pendulispora rubella]|uniref:Type II secretion system F family protein n=1 Tax=Pendulispora rubella TaxID=2741070 RepID=A0ABZ2KSQ1_9BACT